MVTTDGHRLAYVEKKNVVKNDTNESIDTADLDAVGGNRRTTIAGNAASQHHGMIG